MLRRIVTNLHTTQIHYTTRTLFRSQHRFFATTAPVERKRPRLSGGIGKQATALYDQAKEQNAVDEVSKQLAAFKDVYSDEKSGLQMELMDPNIRGEQLTPLLSEIYPSLSITNPLAQHLIQYLVSKRAADKLGAILNDYRTLAQFDKGEVNGTVTSAVPLTPEQLNKLKDVLQSQVQQGQKLILDQQIDPSLLGGLRVSVEDRAIDLSLASRMQAINQQLRQ